MLFDNTTTGCGGSAVAPDPAASGPQPGVIYYIDDHLGSSHLVTDSLGNVIREESRYPYGLERSSQPGPQSESAVAVDYVYTGKEYDAETGLIYFGGRYYSPELGRWITPDPLFLEKDPKKIIDTPMEQNLYAYVQGNPMTLTDEKGEYGARSRELYMNSQALRAKMQANAPMSGWEKAMYIDWGTRVFQNSKLGIGTGLNYSTQAKPAFELGAGVKFTHGVKVGENGLEPYEMDSANVTAKLGPVSLDATNENGELQVPTLSIEEDWLSVDNAGVIELGSSATMPFPPYLTVEAELHINLKEVANPFGDTE